MHFKTSRARQLLGIVGIALWLRDQTAYLCSYVTCAHIISGRMPKRIVACSMLSYTIVVVLFQFNRNVRSMDECPLATHAVNPIACAPLNSVCSIYSRIAYSALIAVSSWRLAGLQVLYMHAVAALHYSVQKWVNSNVK